MSDDVGAVRAANLEFYRAFETLELARMDEAWAHDGQVTCAHPGWALATGWDAVRASWATIFENTVEMRFQIENEQIDVRGELAWIVCVERIRSGGAEGAVLATNVLRRDGGRWRLVHHHGSPLVSGRARAPEVPSGGVLN